MTFRLPPWFIMAAVLLAAYSPIYLNRYAFSDDWFYLYASATDPLSILKWDVLSGRPLYGAIRYLFAPLMHDQRDLVIIRLLSLCSLIVLCGYLYRFLREREVLSNQLQCAVFALLLCLLPSFQVFNAWSVCFPFVTSVLLAGMSYSQLARSQRVTSLLLSALLLTAAFAIYQPTAMAFLFFACLDNCLSARTLVYRKVIFTFVMIGFGMVMALVLSKAVPLMLYGEVLSRTNITTDIVGKALWFVKEPLKNAITNFDLGRKIVAIIIALFVIALGLKRVAFTSKTKCLLIFVFFIAAAIPNLLVTESWAAYRTISAFALIATALFLLGLFSLLEKTPLAKPLYLLLPVVAGVLATSNITSGFTSPQQKEFALFKTELNRRVPQDYNGMLYYRIGNAPLPGIAKSTKYDEFGALSLGMPWTFAGMAAEARKEGGMKFRLTENPVLASEANCPGECKVIEAKDVLSPH